MTSRRIGFTGLGVICLLILWIGWRAGSRYHVLRKIYEIPGARERAAIAPQELDLGTVEITSGTICNLGYAQFSPPTQLKVELERAPGGSGTVLTGNSDEVSLVFMRPYDPQTMNSFLDTLRAEVRTLPKGNVMRRLVENPDFLAIDYFIQAEKTYPMPFSRMFWMGKDEFAAHVMLLAEKTGKTIGGQGVYTYATEATKGLIYVGEKGGDPCSVSVMIDSVSGRHAVGLHVYPSEEREDDVPDLLKPILKTFQFHGESIGTEDEVRKQIEDAGIPTQEQDKKTR